MNVFLKEEVKGEKFELLIDTKIYNKYIILKSAHNFLDKGYFLFNQDKDNNIILQFTSKEGVSEKPEKIILDYTDELLNNILREKVFEENKEIRTEIITSAIQNSLREAELPNDWKGYDDSDDQYFENKINDTNNEIDFDKDINEILKEIENDPELKIDEEEIERILKEIEEETKEKEEEEEEEEAPIISVDTNAVAEMKEKFKK